MALHKNTVGKMCTNTTNYMQHFPFAILFKILKIFVGRRLILFHIFKKCIIPNLYFLSKVFPNHYYFSFANCDLCQLCCRYEWLKNETKSKPFTSNLSNMYLPYIIIINIMIFCTLRQLYLYVYKKIFRGGKVYMPPPLVTALQYIMSA